MRAGLVAIAALIALAGCRGEPEVMQPPAPQVKDRLADWPADTLPRPEFLSTVDREAGRVKGDAEPTRIPVRYKMPDWAQPTSPISMKSPKLARLTFHFRPRDEAWRKDDDQRMQDLKNGKPRGSEELVLARPWVGWFGGASGKEALPENRERAYSLRVYHLFANNRHLEIHLEWPTGDKLAFEEGLEMLGHLVYSIEPSE